MQSRSGHNDNARRCGIAGEGTDSVTARREDVRDDGGAMGGSLAVKSKSGSDLPGQAVAGRRSDAATRRSIVFSKASKAGFSLSADMAALAIAACMLASPAIAQQTAVQRGEYLARAGDCVSCHTAQGGAPFAGGLAPRHAVRLHAVAEHHARSGDGHRPLVERRLLPRAARWREQARPGHVSDDALRLLHPGHARGHRRDLRVPAHGEAGAQRR